MRVYISGKMTGLDKMRFKLLFMKAEKELLAQGHDPINPARLSDFNLTYAEFMAIDGELLRLCDAIYLLENWQDSNGAKVEKEYAESLGLKIMYEKG